LRDAVGDEHDLLEYRSGHVKVGFLADKATGQVCFSRAANPVEPDLYRLVLSADDTFRADDADLELSRGAAPPSGGDLLPSEALPS